MQTRGHIIFQHENKWKKVYLAYNASEEYTLPLLQTTSKFTDRLAVMESGVSTIEKHDEESHVYEYHDYRNFDHLKHKTTEHETLEEALTSCTLQNVFILENDKWSYRQIEIQKPAQVRRNIWRERKKKNSTE